MKLVFNFSTGKFDYVSTAGDFYTDNDARYLKLSADNDPITGNLILKPTTDSLSNLEVQDEDANVILSVDSVNNRVGILTATPSEAFDVHGDFKVAASTSTTTDGTGTVSTIFGGVNGTDTLFLTELEIGSVISAGGYTFTITSVVTDTLAFATEQDQVNSVPFTILPRAISTVYVKDKLGIGVANPTKSLEVLGSASVTGDLLVKPSTDVTSAFEVQDKDANVVLSVDTINNRIGIGINNPTYPIHIVGTANAATYLAIQTTSTGTGASANIYLQNSDGINNAGQIFKCGTGYTTYKTLKVSDLGIYNAGAGNMTFLNDYASGNINFTAGGASVVQMVLLSTGNVGIGTTTPIGKFEVETDGASQIGAFSVYSDTAAHEPLFYLRRGRGTLAVPATLQDGDIMGSIRWAGQMNTTPGSFSTSAKIEGIARGTFNSGNLPTDIAFYTTAASSGATPVERMRILSTGNVLINGFTAAVIGLTVKGASAQSANLQEWQNSSAGVLTAIGPNGTMGIGTNVSTSRSLIVNKGLTTNSTWVAGDFTLNVIPTGTNSTSQYGTRNVVNCAAAQTFSSAYYGGDFAAVADNNSSNVSGSLIAGSYASGADATYTATIANAISIQAQTYVYASTMTTGKAINILSPTISTGTVTNLYGLYINNISGAGTLNYAIYTGTGLNQLGDQLKIDLVADKIGLIVQSHSSQTADLQEWQTSAGGVLGKVTGGTLTTTGRVNFTETINDETGNLPILQAQINIAPTGNTAVSARGMNFYISTATGTAHNYTAGLYGALGGVLHNGNGTMSSPYGGYFYNRLTTGTGTMTDAAGVYGLTEINFATAGATITRARGGLFGVHNRTASTTIGTATGVEVETPTVTGTITNMNGILVNWNAATSAGISVGVNIAASSAAVKYKYGLAIGNVTGGTSDNYAIYTGTGTVLFGDKLAFTQTDGNEYIDSLNDGYLDIYATTNVRTNVPVRGATSLYRRYYHIALGASDPGASGATWVVASANTTGGWRLDASTEKVRGQADIHADWDGATDLTFKVNFMVNVDNTGGGAGDTVDLRANVYYKGIGDTATKTQALEVATVVGASAQYKQFSATFTINWDETSNVVEVGDVISFVLNLETDTSEVDDIVVTSMEFYYQTTHSSIESGDI